MITATIQNVQTAYDILSKIVPQKEFEGYKPDYEFATSPTPSFYGANDAQQRAQEKIKRLAESRRDEVRSELEVLAREVDESGTSAHPILQQVVEGARWTQLIMPYRQGFILASPDDGLQNSRDELYRQAKKEFIPDYNLFARLVGTREFNVETWESDMSHVKKLIKYAGGICTVGSLTAGAVGDPVFMSVIAIFTAGGLKCAQFISKVLTSEPQLKCERFDEIVDILYDRKPNSTPLQLQTANLKY